MAAREAKVIDVALQGGGAHGAFTWGVLDRLLEHEGLSIEAISGTSAGAMNGALVADGLVRGGREAAREALERFWSAVSAAAMFSPVRRSPVDMLLGRWSLDWSPGYLALETISRVFSPYDLNPLDINPLRDLVESCIDFDRVNSCPDLKLFVTATNVRNGLPKVFRQPQISVDALMASACLPTLFKAVEIDGEAYWDGGFMGNPALAPLIDDCGARDLVIVRINPLHREELPRSAPEIADRINEITFNASLIKELRAFGFLKELIRSGGEGREGYRDARLHAIAADEAMLEFSVSTKLNAEWAFLQHLRGIGRDAADRWLREHYDDIGRRGTFDIGFVYSEALRPTHLDEEMPPTGRG